MITKNQDRCGGEPGKPNWRRWSNDEQQFEWVTENCLLPTDKPHNARPCDGCHDCCPDQWCECGKELKSENIWSRIHGAGRERTIIGRKIIHADGSMLRVECQEPGTVSAEPKRDMATEIAQKQAETLAEFIQPTLAALAASAQWKNSEEFKRLQTENARLQKELEDDRSRVEERVEMLSESRIKCILEQAAVDGIDGREIHRLQETIKRLRAACPETKRDVATEIARKQFEFLQHLLTPSRVNTPVTMVAVPTNIETLSVFIRPEIERLQKELDASQQNFRNIMATLFRDAGQRLAQINDDAQAVGIAHEEWAGVMNTLYNAKKENERLQTENARFQKELEDDRARV